MKFGDILDKWEKQAGDGGYNKEIQLSRDLKVAGYRDSSGERRRRLLRKRPDATIDLHGLTRDEAWTALDIFFTDCRRNGFDKLLVIHGKGNHLGGGTENRGYSEGVLKELSKRFIENCPFAGESGYSHAKDGGQGATWVILKEVKK